MADVNHDRRDLTYMPEDILLLSPTTDGAAYTLVVKTFHTLIGYHGYYRIVYVGHVISMIASILKIAIEDDSTD